MARAAMVNKKSQVFVARCRDLVSKLAFWIITEPVHFGHPHTTCRVQRRWMREIGLVSCKADFEKKQGNHQKLSKRPFIPFVSNATKNFKKCRHS